ncbi:hypothetical protein HK101_001402 [Irineochytrium annulatum]|nr:hypothetical protein HK101_001402 [Irineochytrium annulatum]
MSGKMSKSQIRRRQRRSGPEAAAPPILPPPGYPDSGVFTNYRLPSDIEARAAVGIEEEIVKLERLRISRDGEGGALTGTRPLDDATKAAYKQKFDGLRFFFSLVGDYESLVILEKCPPAFCPAMNAKTVVSFINFKYGKSGTPCLDASGASVLDVNKVPVLCDGKWKSPSNMHQLLAAINAVHCARKHTRDYEGPCPNCWAHENENTRNSEDPERKLLPRIDGCIVHRNGPRLFRVGNPTVAQELRDRNREQTKALSGYKPEVIKVEGKADKHPVNLIIWSHPEVPELDLLPHLFTYLYFRGHSSGYIFPDFKSTDPDIPMDYEAYQHRFTTLCSKILSHRDARYGSHSGRKTAYFLATWGDGNQNDMMLSARHKDPATAARYMSDGSALLELAKVQPDWDRVSSWIPRWKSIFSERIQMARNINHGSARAFVNLYELAVFVVEQHYGFSSRHINNSITWAVELAIEYERPRTDKEKLYNFIDKLTGAPFDENHVATMKIMIESYVGWMLSSTSIEISKQFQERAPEATPPRKRPAAGGDVGSSSRRCRSPPSGSRGLRPGSRDEGRSAAFPTAFMAVSGQIDADLPWRSDGMELDRWRCKGGW